MNKYILSNGMDDIIRIFDTQADLHRWINSTYPNTEGTNSRGRALSVPHVLPSIFRITKVRSDRLGV